MDGVKTCCVACFTIPGTKGYTFCAASGCYCAVGSTVTAGTGVVGFSINADQCVIMTVSTIRGADHSHRRIMTRIGWMEIGEVSSMTGNTFIR